LFLCTLDPKGKFIFFIYPDQLPRTGHRTNATSFAFLRVNDKLFVHYIPSILVNIFDSQQLSPSNSQEARDFYQNNRIPDGLG